MTPEQSLVRYYESALRRIVGLRQQFPEAADAANAAIDIATDALAARCAHCGEPMENPDTHVCEGKDVPVALSEGDGGRG